MRSPCKKGLQDSIQPNTRVKQLHVIPVTVKIIMIIDKNKIY